MGVSHSLNYSAEHGFWHGEGIQTVEGDVNGDLCVNVADLLTVRNNLGNAGSDIIPPEADINDDDICNVADLLTVRNRLGEGPGCD